MKKSVPLISAASILLFGALLALACNVPVFRYALERWPADAYQVIVFHQGPLAPDDLALVKMLEKGAESREAPPNVVFQAVDLAKETDPELRKIFQNQSKVELPWMVVRYPDGRPVWFGRLQPEIVRSLYDSPTRRELAKRVLAGETAVFVLLESGDHEKDDGAASLLECQLPELAKVLKLPDLSDDPADKINEGGPPLKIAFSWLRVSRSDPAERMLVEMLLHADPEEDLSDRKEPMVYPVFGRGRSLWPQIGLGINARNIEDDGAFLVGPCSCTVKRMNPGFDLLLAVDWDSRLPGRFSKEPDRPKLQGLSTFVPPNQELAPEPRLAWGDGELAPEPRVFIPAYPPASLPPANSPVLRNILLAGLAGLVILTVATLVLLSKDRSRTR